MSRAVKGRGIAAGWFMRNVVAVVPRESQDVGADAVCTVFGQPLAEHVREQLSTIAGMLGRQFSKVEAMLRHAAVDVTAFADFPIAHW